ncbi:hypothetical protein OROHE_014098 [Orobanche hederae]
MPLSDGEQDEDSTLSKRNNRYKKGDRVDDVKDLLFNQSRDFLVKYNSQLGEDLPLLCNQVKAEHLDGKVIVLHFERVKPSSSCYKLITSNTWRHTGHLVEIYPKLLSSACPFEVVFIAVTDVSDGTEDALQKRFQEMFSFMPWTAVPFFDSETRKRLANCFVASEHGGYHLPPSFVISNTGVVLQHDARPIFRIFGADAYPFSDERIECLIMEDDLLREPRLSLKALLASPERDYVINNKGHKVNICDLEDKMVALYLYEEGCTNDLTTSLRNAYKILVHKEKKKFENRSRKHLRQCLGLPWTAVPFFDSETRKRLANCFVASEHGGYHLPSSFVISNTGVVLQHDARPIFRIFGADAYPFSDERIECLIMEDDLLREPRLSLKALLASPERDYVINNKGHKVNICDLEDKMVALYLYEEGCTNDLTTSLRNVYEILVHKEKKKFEVVLIYIHDSLNTLGRTDAESFKKVFETMPWLALPFKDTNCKKVQRVFLYPFGLDGPHPNHSLVIIGPSGELIEPFGAGTVLKNFGIEAYPFTREKAHLLHVQKVKNLKLDMLWGPEAVFMRGYLSDVTSFDALSTYREVLFSNINVGQRIIVFRDTENVWHRELRMKLQKMYLERKGSNDEFEVLHIGLRRGTVPWLRVHPDFGSRESDAVKVLRDIFCNAYGVLFFDFDGKVVRAAMIPPVSDTDFPFYVGASSLETEVLIDLIDRFDWDLHTFRTAIRGQNIYHR